MSLVYSSYKIMKLIYKLSYKQVYTKVVQFKLILFI